MYRSSFVTELVMKTRCLTHTHTQRENPTSNVSRATIWIGFFWPHALSAVAAVNSENDEACCDIKQEEGWHGSIPLRAQRPPHQPRTDVPPPRHTWFSISRPVRSLKGYVTFTTSVWDNVIQQFLKGGNLTSSFVDSVSSFVALCCFCTIAYQSTSVGRLGAVFLTTTHVLPLLIENKLETYLYRFYIFQKSKYKELSGTGRDLISRNTPFLVKMSHWSQSHITIYFVGMCYQIKSSHLFWW